MKKNQINYVIIGDPENAEHIGVMQTLKDGTKILLLVKVYHCDKNSSHYHTFNIVEATITYDGRDYEGVFEDRLVKGVFDGRRFKGFTIDGQKIEQGLNRFLNNLVAVRREKIYLEGMKKLLCDVEKIPYVKSNW